MDNKNNNTNIKQKRYFSEEFRKAKVKEIEQKQISIAKLTRLYNISRSPVYYWIKKYSTEYKQATRIVVELESESQKTERLQLRVAELERIVGQKQLEIDFLNKLVEISSEELGVDPRQHSISYLGGYSVN
jgi:transposase-like protein